MDKASIALKALASAPSGSSLSTLGRRGAGKGSRRYFGVVDRHGERIGGDEVSSFTISRLVARGALVENADDYILPPAKD